MKEKITMLLQGENNNKNGHIFKEIKIIAKPSFINVYTPMQYKIKNAVIGLYKISYKRLI